MKTKFFILFWTVAYFTAYGQQSFVNQLWKKEHSIIGNQEIISTKVDYLGNLIHLGNQKNSYGYSNILLSCVHSDGVTNWSQLCTNSNTSNNFGVDMVVDNNGNIYVTGVSDNGTNKDYFTAKYDQTGNLLWQQNYNGNLDDVPVAITIDGVGNVYVTGSSYGNGTMTDILTIKYDNSGVQQWISVYNFNNKVEISKNILIDGNGDVLVLGTSANNFNNSDFVLIKYDNNGNQIQVKRHATPGNGFDLPEKVVVDNLGNYYVTGTAQSNGDKSIKTVSYNSNLQVLWAEYIDLHGDTDESFGIDVDNTGHVFVAGYSVNPIGGHSAVIINYSAVDGSQNWIKEIKALDEFGIAKAKLAYCENNKVYFGAETTSNGERNYLLLSINETGVIKIANEINLTQNDQVHSLVKDDNNLYLSGVSDSANIKKATTIKLNTFEKDNGMVLNGFGTPVALDDELIVRFNPNDLILDNVDNPKITWGIVKDFVKEDAILILKEKTKLDFGQLKCYKVFPNVTSADTINYTHSGEAFPIPPLHATFGVLLPTNTNDTIVLTQLMDATPQIFMVTYNHLYELSNLPNDIYINDGSSAGLIPTQNIPNANINVEGAWDVETGDEAIVVGVYDSGINKVHEDMSDGSISTSVVKAGYDYLNNAPNYNLNTTDDMGHGTAVSSIIGAKRNNTIGSAGIAGGDNNQSTPVSIHDMKLFKNKTDPCVLTIQSSNFASVSSIVQALYDGRNGSGTIPVQQLIKNHSWNGPYDALIKEQFVFDYMAGITSICASGNHEDYSYNGPCSYYTYPNSFTDNLVIKVGGNDTTGGKVNFAQCGGFIDLIAPSTHDLYIVPDNTTNTYTDYLDPTDPTCPPSFINGTSFGTPHTTGVAALMQSYYYKNVPINIDPNIENILAPEDIEEMMQRNATDITFGTGATTGYDDPTGYGRLNAGAIFDSLTYPRFLIYHLKFDLPLSSVSMMAQEMTCLESIQDTNWNIPLGVTTVKRYKIDAIQNHTLPQGYSFIDGWSRGSASKNIYGINSSNSTSNPCLELDPNLYNYTIPNASNPTMIHVTQNSVFLRGYIYELLDDNNNTVGWLPASPQDIATFAYSLYLVNETAGLDQNKVGSFSLFPNPSQSTVTLTFEQPQTANTKLWVADLNGRKVLSLPLNYLTEGSKSVTFDVSKFASGIYMVVLQNEKGTHTEKLVVE